eukprot:13546360-Heterocapsa_arctica.AAC.1
MLGNGDWRRTDAIDIFMPDGIDFDQEAIKEGVAESIRLCFASARFTLYPRTRWTRCDEAWDQFCMFE